jgi:hypothetical protein
MARDKKVSVRIDLKDRASSGLKKFKDRLLNIKNIIGAGIGLAILNKGLRETVGRAQSAESGLKRLGVAMQSAGRFTEENLQSFERLAVQLEKTTGFQEEQVLQALAVLQTFGQMTRSDMEKTIVATLNMATVFNEDLTQAAIRLGKAYNGQLIGLQRMGVGISKATFNAKGFGAVLEQLGKEQGGQAVARLKGFEGATLRVGVAFGEVGKEAGKFITANRAVRTVLDSLSGGLNIIANGLRRFRLSEKDSSDVVQRLTEDLKRQKEAMEAVGQVAESNVLVLLKLEQIALNRVIAEGTEQIRRNVDASMVQQTVAQRFGIELTKLNKLEGQILALEGDINVQGSKANSINRERLRILKEREDVEKALIKTGEDAFDNLTREGEVIKASITRLQELKERRRDTHNEHKENTLAAQIFVSESLEALRKMREEAADEEEKIEIEKLTTVFENLQKRANITKQFLDDELSAVVRNANAQKTIIDRLESDRIRRQTDAIKTVLQEDKLNAQDRSILLDDIAQKAIQLQQNISEVGQDPVKLEAYVQQLNRLRDIMSGITDREADAINETFNEIQSSIDETVQALSKLDFEALFNMAGVQEGVVRDMKALAQLGRKTFEDEFNARPLSLQLNLDNIDFTGGFNNL